MEEFSNEETLITSLNVEDYTDDYLILDSDWTQENINLLAETTGHTYIDRVMMFGEEYTILSQTDEQLWLSQEPVDQIWDGDDWVDVD